MTRARREVLPMNNNEIRTLIITQRDIIDSGCFDIGMAIDTAREAILSFAAGRILFPDKVTQVFDESTQCRTNCLPATLFDEQVSGMKWISVFPTNRAAFGLQNLSAVMLLSSTRTGFPLAFMEGTLISNMRTAAVSALGAEKLARSSSRTIGFIGAGEQAKFHFLAIKHAFPGLTRCMVSSRTAEREQSFIGDIAPLFPETEFVACSGNYKKAVEDADIIVTAISGQEPILKPEWIKKGAFYAHVGGWEDDYAVPLMADRIVCDNWNSVKHRTQTISRLYKMGRLADGDIFCDIDALLTGRLPGRRNDDEFIYFNSVGLSYVDVALANKVYKTCRAKGLGSEFVMQDQNLFTALKGGLGKC